MHWLIRRPWLGLPHAALLATSACSTAAPDEPFGVEPDVDPTATASSSGCETSGDDEFDPTSDAGTTGGSGTTGDAGDPPGELPLRPGPLRPDGELWGASWSDLDAWAAWADVLRAAGPWSDEDLRWGLPTVGRRWSLSLDGPTGPAADVPVTITGDNEELWSARTDAKGRVEMFADFDDATPITVMVDETLVDLTPSPGESASIEIVAAPAPAPVLDLMFVIDTTGSMGDELAYLQDHLEDIIEKVRSRTDPGLEIRLSLNYYRDHDEEYVVRSQPFSTDIGSLIEDLDAQEASGGGDIPEAVDLALEDAVFDHAWSSSARARLMFLVLDAPLRDEPASLQRLQDSIAEAARLGIRVMPVTGTRTEESTAFFVRQLAIVTGGTYNFVTEPTSLAGLSELDTLGAYEPRPLDEILWTSISEQLD
jgi:hypothetical protein